MRAQKLVYAMLLTLSASGAYAERVNCWDSQMSQIVAHSAEQTLGNFELSGVSREIVEASGVSREIVEASGVSREIVEASGISRNPQSSADEHERVLAYKCSGTFLLGSERKQYSYLCELHDESGDKFTLQNGSTNLGDVQYVTGGGTGKYAERSGVAAEYQYFPINRDGSLSSCDPHQSAFKLP